MSKRSKIILTEEEKNALRQLFYQWQIVPGRDIFQHELKS